MLTPRPGQRVTLHNNVTYSIVADGKIVSATATGNSFQVCDNTGVVTTFHREWPSAVSYVEDHAQAKGHNRTRRFFITTETL